MRAWTVTAAVLAFLHAGTSFLGAMGAALTADNAEPMTTDEALGVAAVIALMAIATAVGAILLLTGRPWPVLVAAGLSLAISVYLVVRVGATPGGYQLPLIFAVLPAAVVAIVGTGLGRRPRVVTA